MSEKLKVVYTGEEMPDTINKSIFLAGPSLRPGQEKEMDSWRKDALQILEDKGFDGVVFCPENRDFVFKNKDFNYDDQVEWEEKYLNIADCILFWVPRDLSSDPSNNGMPKLAALTTNIEWGTWASSGKVVLGFPEDAEKMTYMNHYAEKFNVPVSDSLSDTLQNAIDMLASSSERTEGERYVPLFIWNTDSFQAWYKAQTNAGNKLEKAQLLYTFRPRFKKFVFLWVLKVEVYVAAEDRVKSNEFVLSRPDISSVCLYYEDSNSESIFDKEIVLIKEFRSPASTEDGFILELPSGSSSKESNPADTAAEELHEETGFYIEPERLKLVSSRQLAGTLSAHKSSLFVAKLNKEEIDWFKSQKDIVHGNQKDTERTFIEVYSLKELLDNNKTDWSTLGMILSINE